MQSRQFARKFGNDLLETLSHNVARSPIAAISELAANSYDADAHNIEILFRSDRIVISDDGHGMSPEEIPNFYRVGDSPKKDKKVSPGGRPFLGSFGLATLSLRMLGKEYTLDTRKGEHRTVVQERFKEPMSLEDVLESQVFPNSSGNSGTLLDIRDLKIRCGKDFSPEALINYLGWSLPITQSDFSITVNGQKVVSKLIENADKFTFEDTRPAMGSIRGVIYVTSYPSREAGVYVKVNGRNIGDPKELISMGGLKNSLINRIVVQVEANDMQKYIRSDRGEFMPGNARQELTEALTEQLKEVRRFMEQKRKMSIGKRLGSKKEMVLSEVASRLRGARIDEIQGRGIKFSDEVPGYLPGVLNERAILLNGQYPVFQEWYAANAHVLRETIITAAIDTIAAHRAAKRGGSWEAFAKEKILLLDKLKPRISGSTRHEIFRNAHYNPAVLARLSGLELESIRYMVNRGVLLQSGDDIKGKDFLHAQALLHGLVPLPTFLERYAQVAPSGPNIDHYEGVFNLLDGAAAPFIQRVGTQDSCYAVEPLCAKEIASLTQNINLRQTNDDFMRRMREYGNQWIHFNDFAKRINVKNGEIAAAVNHAQDKKLNLRTEENGSGRYSFADLIRVFQDYRSRAVET